MPNSASTTRGRLRWSPTSVADPGFPALVANPTIQLSPHTALGLPTTAVRLSLWSVPGVGGVYPAAGANLRVIVMEPAAPLPGPSFIGQLATVTLGGIAPQQGCVIDDMRGGDYILLQIWGWAAAGSCMVTIQEI